MANNTFASLKKSSKKNFKELSNKMESLNKRDYGNDDLWKATRGKDGNGFAVIRFLPPASGDDMPWVQMYDHGFQGPGGWYIEKSLTTIGQDDPCSEHNSKLWNTGLDADKDTARKQKRRTGYYSNIYVVKDPANPDNEGKVFKFKYGVKIFEKIKDALNPTFADEDPVNVFDLWEGANFKLKISTVDKFPNYDKSTFDTPGAMINDDDKMEEVWKSCESLEAMLDVSNFKTYDQLQTKLNRVLGLAKAAEKPISEADLDNEIPFETEETPETAEDDAATATSTDSGSSDSDAELEFFKSLTE